MRTAVCAGLILVFCGCVASAYTVEELETLASSEAILEISRAAGIALVDHFVATKSVDELRELARSTRVGISCAARLALRAIDDPVAALIGFRAEELKRLALEAESSEERLDAARAYFLMARESLTRAGLESEAGGASEWALAAGEVLGGYYAAYRILSIDELRALAVESPAAGIRCAASVALAALWVADGLSLTDQEIEVEIVRLTLWRPDLASAYMGVLAHRFLEGMESP